MRVMTEAQKKTALIGAAIGYYQGFLFMMLCSPGEWFMVDYPIGQALFVVLHLWLLWSLLWAGIALAVRAILQQEAGDA